MSMKYRIIKKLYYRMQKNKIACKTKKPVPAPPPSQHTVNTQQNFMSINELSSMNEGEKNVPTISNIRKKYLMQGLINRLKFLIAPFVAPPNMKQNWNDDHKTDLSDEQKSTERQAMLDEISYKYGLWHVLLIIQALCAVLLFWMASTELVFLPKFQTQLSYNLISFQLKALPCFLIMMKLLVRELLVLRERILLKKSISEQQEEDDKLQIDKHLQEREAPCVNFKPIFGDSLEIAALALYLVQHTIESLYIKSILLALIVVVFFVKAWNLRQNLEKIYSYVESKDYKNQFRIIVLFFVLLSACHLISLILYSMTYMYPDRNWINSVDKIAVRQNTWVSHYTCSIYFTITTMATVGYGDFTPVEAGQMFFVSFIQLFGSALFGYMINVVGLSVAQINKKNKQFDNHISTINKLQNHYQITRQLSQKFKNQIIKNQSIKKETPLSETEQTEFFKMVQSSLKQEFILETNIKVIKKSIFFLTYFTVNFQNEIALKLIRKIYKKNQRVPLVEWDGQNTQRCMLIINSGSIDIEIANQSSNIETKKLIKSISPQQGKPTLNVFGYSALILNKDIDLQATTKDTSVIYLLKRRDVLQCMDKNMLDFEGISEIRQRMLNYKNINHIEAPSMLDIEKHYVPNIFFVNKRKKTIYQDRVEEYKRRNRRCRLKVITMKNYQFRTMMCIDIEEEEVKSIDQICNKVKLTPRLKPQLADEFQNQSKIVEDPKINEANRDIFLAKIDQFKDFENFMKKSNISKLILKYHEYQRGVRKHRKIMQNVQEMIKEQSCRDQTSRMHTFTQGVSKSHSRMDQRQ